MRVKYSILECITAALVIKMAEAFIIFLALYALFLIEGEKYSFINHTVMGEALNAGGVLIVFEATNFYFIFSSLLVSLAILTLPLNQFRVGGIVASIFVIFSAQQIPPFRTSDILFWLFWLITAVSIGFVSASIYKRIEMQRG